MSRVVLVVLVVLGSLMKNKSSRLLLENKCTANTCNFGFKCIDNGVLSPKCEKICDEYSQEYTLCGNSCPITCSDLVESKSCGM